MINPKVSLQNFQQNLRIEKQISQSKGYHLQNTAYKPPKQAQKEPQHKLSINANLNPLQVQNKHSIKSPRYKELLKELEQLQMEKKINSMAGQGQGKGKGEGASSNLDIEEIIDRKIREYNYLIQHRHLGRRRLAKSVFEGQSEGERKRDKAEEGEEEKVLLEKIKSRQKDLDKTGNFMAKFKRNQQIVSLYRQYSNSIRLSDRAHEKGDQSQLQPYLPRSKKSENSFQNSNQKSQVKIKLGGQTEKLPKPRYDQFNIEEPYVGKKFMESSQELNESTRRNRNLSQILRERIGHLRDLREEKVGQVEEDQRKDGGDQDIGQLRTNLSEFSLEYNRISSRMQNNTSDTNESKKHSCLSIALQKISPRYIKCQGSKFLTRYKVNQLAKSMIEGPSLTEKKQTKPIIHRSNIRKIKVPADLTNEDKMVLGLMIQEESDAYYWTTCRNQKINLMLKRHQPH